LNFSDSWSMGKLSNILQVGDTRKAVMAPRTIAGCMAMCNLLDSRVMGDGVVLYPGMRLAPHALQVQGAQTTSCFMLSPNELQMRSMVLWTSQHLSSIPLGDELTIFGNKIW
jgi:hypothetical protein